VDKNNKCVERFLAYCKQQRNLSKHTLKAYSLDLKQFIEFIGTKNNLQNLERNDLSDFHSHLSALDLAPRTIKRKLACLTSMFSWLEKENEIQLNPFHRFKSNIKLPKSLPKNVQKSDLQKMLLAARNRTHCPSEKHLSNNQTINNYTALIALELLLSTGIRVGELVHITIQNIFLKERKIKIWGKGARERYVYLPDTEISTLIEDYIAKRSVAEPKTDVLLVNSKGNQASTQFIRKLIKEIAQQANTNNHVTPHMLRHSVACELLNLGLDIRFVQRLLGHSSISTTEIYTHVSDKTLQDKIEQTDLRSKIMQ